MSLPQYPSPSGPPAGPPQPPAGWQQPGWAGPQPQPRKSGAGKILGFGCLGIVLLLLVIGILGAVASGGGGDPMPGASRASTDSPGKTGRSGAEGPTGDVRIAACEIESFTKWPSAKVTITNRGSKTSNYMIQVEFLDANGTRISEGFAATNNLRPGRIAKETAQGTAEASGRVTCRVTEVTRYAS
jgi:hypothetical protein